MWNDLLHLLSSRQQHKGAKTMVLCAYTCSMFVPVHIYASILKLHTSLMIGRAKIVRTSLPWGRWKDYTWCFHFGLLSYKPCHILYLAQTTRGGEEKTWRRGKKGSREAAQNSSARRGAKAATRRTREEHHARANQATWCTEECHFTRTRKNEGNRETARRKRKSLAGRAGKKETIRIGGREEEAGSCCCSRSSSSCWNSCRRSSSDRWNTLCASTIVRSGERY